MGNADKELMQRLAQGDAVAFETVFRTHYTLLLRYACKITGDKAAAEHVVQLVFANIWEGRKRLEVKQLKPYLLRATHNKSLTFLMQHQRQASLELLPPLAEEEVDEVDEQREEVVRLLIDALPEQRRRIFKMSRLDGLKYREIATQLGLSVKTVEAQMGKALQFLRSSLPQALKNSEVSD